MPGTKTFIASVLLTASFAVAAAPEYFPLQAGNSWAYRGTAKWFDSQQTVAVLGKETLRNVEYTKVQFFGRTIYLRAAGETLNILNTTSGQEGTFLRFDAPEGERFSVDVDNCTNGAQVESRAAKVTTPAGEWSDALQFTFQTQCADAGVTTMYLVKGVGPVVYETTSLAGPVRYSLNYARATDTAVGAPELAFTAALDSPRYKAADTVNIAIRLTVRNTTTQPVVLTFPSGQRYDLRIWNDKGEGAYTWSADKLFIAEMSTDTIAPGERTFAFTANVPNLRPGRYLAEMWLATQSREFVSTIGFVVE